MGHQGPLYRFDEMVGEFATPLEHDSHRFGGIYGASATEAHQYIGAEFLSHLHPPVNNVHPAIGLNLAKNPGTFIPQGFPYALRQVGVHQSLIGNDQRSGSSQSFHL